MGKYTEAIGFFLRITADESNDDLETKSAAFCASGVSEMMRGNYSKAEAFLLDAISLQNRNNDLTGEAVTRLHMARLFRREGKRARSKEECLKVVEICNASPSKQARLQTAAAHQIATIELEEGNLASARETFFRILELADDGKKDKAMVWQQIATIDMRGGAYDSARENFFRSLELRRELGVHAELATTLNSLGRIDIQLREFALAKPKLTEALAIARWLRTPAEEAETWHHLGLLAIGLGKPDRGVRLLALARSLFEAIGHADAQQARADLQHAIDALGYPSGETKRILADVEASYYADGGQTLYREAFGEELPILTDH